MRGGPITLAEFMQDALTSPHGGYYMTRDVFGASGDFVTSPEISQLFGEMVGIWAVHTWMQMGQPPRLNLVELGPGRGTLMADLLRGTAAFKAFTASLQVHLVEVSPALRALQWQALKCQSVGPAGPDHHAALTQSVGPAGPDHHAASTQHAIPAGSDHHHAASTQRVIPAGPDHRHAAPAQIRMHERSQGAAAAPAQAARGADEAGAAAAADSAAGPSAEQGTCMGASASPALGESSLTGRSELAGCQVVWHHVLESVPSDQPAIYVAHEFFDALPVHQFVRDARRGWLEKMVDVADGGSSKEERGPQPLASGQEASSRSPFLGRQEGTRPARDAAFAGEGSSEPSASAGQAGGSGPAAAQQHEAQAAQRQQTQAAWQQQTQAAQSGGPEAPTAGTAPPAFRFVLSPTRTPATALLVPRRLAALARAEASASSQAVLSGEGGAVAASGRSGGRTGGLIVPPGAAAPAGDAALGRPHGGAAASDAPSSSALGSAADMQQLEVSAKAMAAAEALALRVGRHGGAALIIDYGKDGPYADSLVALRGHESVDVLDDPGSADLSAWVDFGALRQAALESGAPVACHGPVSQQELLHALGIQARLEQLLKRARSSDEAQALILGFERITLPQHMGATYKAMVVAHESLAGVAGFEHLSPLVGNSTRDEAPV